MTPLDEFKAAFLLHLSIMEGVAEAKRKTARSSFQYSVAANEVELLRKLQKDLATFNPK